MKQIFTVALLGVVLFASGVNAQVPVAEWEEFKAQFAAMSERVKALEAENAQLRQASRNTIKVEDLAATNAELDTLKERTTASSWADRVAWEGDYRFRYETIDQQGRDDRDRYRIRARPALVATVSDTTVVGFGLATGSDDPVSSNQTLGEGGKSKDINLDLAYATWTGLPGTAITAGKFANPYYTVQKSQLLFDSDFRPEGVAVNWANEMFFAHTSFNFIESDSSQSGKDDYGVWAAQLGTVLTPVEDTKLTLSAGYVNIPTKGEAAIYDEDFFGNSSVTVDGEDVYEYDYKLVTASVDLGLSVFDLPLNFYADYVQNQDVDDQEMGYMAGVKLGSAKKKGNWQVQYEYERLEANATLGVITNSDFAGGGTNGKGSTFSAKYAIDDRWYVAGTYFFDNKRGFETPGDDANYDRIQLDTGFSY
ncbi:MAG: putative porin [Halioglobus sp.]|nr:putative porin [Halioglobus sp.]